MMNISTSLLKNGVKPLNQKKLEQIFSEVESSLIKLKENEKTELSVVMDQYRALQLNSTSATSAKTQEIPGYCI